MFAYIIDLYHRAINNQALTPRERAALKAVQGFVLGFIVDIARQLVPVLMNGGHINLTQSAIVSIVFGFLLGLIKLWAAQSDPAVGVILDAYSKELENQGLQGLTAQTINGTLHVPAVQMIIPSPSAITASSSVPVHATTTYVKAPVTHQGATEDDIAAHNVLKDTTGNASNFNASSLAQTQNRQQFAGPPPPTWGQPTQPQDLTQN